MEVYALYVNDEPIHAFVAPDLHGAACVVRSMIERTLYGYRMQAVIAAHTSGAMIPEAPSILRAIEEHGLQLFHFDPEKQEPDQEDTTIDDCGGLLNFDDIVEDTYMFLSKLKGGDLFG